MAKRRDAQRGGVRPTALALIGAGAICSFFFGALLVAPRLGGAETSAAAEPDAAASAPAASVSTPAQAEPPAPPAPEPPFKVSLKSSDDEAAEAEASPPPPPAEEVRHSEPERPVRRVQETPPVREAAAAERTRSTRRPDPDVAAAVATRRERSRPELVEAPKSPPARKPEPPAVESAAAAEDVYSVRVGRFASRDEAVAYGKKLAEEAGQESFPVEEGGRFRLQVGVFRAKGNAEAAVSQLKEKDVKATVTREKRALPPAPPEGGASP